MMGFVKRFFALTLSAALTAISASLMSSYRVIGNLREIGAPISDATATLTALYDLQHFAPFFMLFIFIAFLIAFLVGGAVFKTVKFGRTVIYITAGALAIFVMLYLMQKVFFGIPIVAGARDNLGLALQSFAGGLGGFVFSLLTDIKTDIKKDPPAKDESINKAAKTA